MIISSALFQTMISMLSLFECIRSRSSGSLEEIKLIFIVMNFPIFWDFSSFKYGLISSRYSLIDRALFLLSLFHIGYNLYCSLWNSSPKYAGNKMLRYLKWMNMKYFFASFSFDELASLVFVIYFVRSSCTCTNNKLKHPGVVLK